MNHRIMSRIVLPALLLLAGASPAMAQDFPGKVVRIISPYSSGAGPDVVARVLGEKLSKTWGQTVIVDAKPGGNGFIALDAGKRAAPTGNDLILVGNAHMTINPGLFRKLPYDSEADFAPVAMLYHTPFFVTVASNGPYKNMRDLMAAAKSHPGRISYGSPYIGSPAHLGSALLESLTDTQMIHVPFKDALQLYTSVANGDVSWALGTAATTSALVQGGKIKIIAVAAKQRLPDYPDVPTVQQALGLPDYEVDAWIALMAPKQTPSAVIKRINADINAALAMPDVKDRFKIMGFVPAPGTPASLGTAIHTDLKMYGELIKRAGVPTE